MCVCVRAREHFSLRMFLGLIFNLSNQPHMHWNVNPIDTQLPTCCGTSWCRYGPIRRTKM